TTNSQPFFTATSRGQEPACAPPVSPRVGAGLSHSYAFFHAPPDSAPHFSTPSFDRPPSATYDCMDSCRNGTSMNARTQVRLASERRRAERRRARRVAPGQLTPCVIRPAGGDEEGLPGWVHNVSVRGAGLLSSRPFAPGDLLHVLFINAAHTFALSVEVRVV